MLKMYPESSSSFTNSIDIVNYIHGGRGIMKLEAPSGKSHIYLFQKPYDAFPDDVIFVYAIHELKKFYLGMIENSKFRLTKNSRFLPDTEIVRGAFYIVRMSHHQDLVNNTRMTLYHMGLCARCGRKLQSDETVRTGIGKKCRKILGI